MNLAVRLFLLVGALAMSRVVAASADDLVLRFDLSDARIYELVAPVRRACIAEPMRRGDAREKAIERASECIGRRLLLAAEFERVLRVYFPMDITSDELESCVREGEADAPLLKCVRAKM